MTGDGRPLSGAAAQPRRLALLALLVVAAERGVTRDNLLAYLWPDADEERGRRALTQALYALRKDLGADEAFLGMKDLRLNPDEVTTDLAEFRDAVATGNLDRAAELYRGPFLQGFNLPGSDTFEPWVEAQRTALAHEFAELLEQLALRASARADLRGAATWLRRLAGLDPLNARTAIQLMQVLADSGDVAGALQHARVYETLVRQEFDLPPDRDVVALAERLRVEGSARGAAPASVAPRPPASVVVSPPAAPAPVPEPAPLAANRSEVGEGFIPATSEMEYITAESGHTSGWAALGQPRREGLAPRRDNLRRSQWTVRVVAVLVVLSLAAGLFRLWPRGPAAATSPGRVVAVGHITHYAGQGVGTLGQPLGDMLATNLARVEGLRVVSNARMVEVTGQLGGRGDSAASSVEVAREAGATELVDGSLYDVAPGHLRLDLRRVDLATGAVLRAYTVQGSDLFALADSGTGRLAGDFGGQRPAGSLADVTTRSVEAYGFYEQGLRRYFGGDLPAAEQLFARALKADSTFAMAAFYRSQSLSQGTRAEVFAALWKAVQLADGASDRERLLIRATWARVNSSPSAGAIADTLMVRYPAELEGYLLSGMAAMLAGNYEAAHRPLREVITRDSLGLAGKAVRCLACEALQALAASYDEEDSLPAAIHVAREWIRLQPTSGVAWRTLAMMLGSAGKLDSAQAVLAHADSLDPSAPAAWLYQFGLLLRGGRLTEAEELARVQLRAAPPSQRVEAIWDLCLVYRHQGRPKAAVELARQYRDLRREAVARDAAPLSSFLYGQTLFESGNYRGAAAVFDSMSRVRIPDQDASATARNQVWTLTHKASALAAMGDTAGLPALADSIQRFGQLSGLGRDRVLHQYVRGLLARARGRHEEAAAAFRAAIVSTSLGFTRVNYALAGELMALGRAPEAIPYLRSANRSIYEGAALYITHTEIQERMAQAFEAVGRRDSAAVYYQQVVGAWEKAEPEFTPRYLEARGKALRMPERQ